MVRIAFRLNANLSAGSSHIQRSLTLAYGLRELDPSCEISFLVSRTEEYAGTIESEGCRYVDIGPVDLSYEDIEATLEALKEDPADILIVDNPRADEEYLKKMKESVKLLVVIDDQAHLGHYPVHILVNNNLHAHTLGYDCDEDTAFFLGTEFALLRPEYDQYQDFIRNNPEKAHHILVTFGAGDPEGVSVQAVRALKKIGEQFVAAVITGGSFQKGEELAREIGIDPRFIVIPDASDMSRRMAWADLALSSPGTTFYELMFMNVPSMLLMQEEKQARILEYAGKNGLAVSLGEASALGTERFSEQISALMLDKPERDRISGRMGGLVDGLGRFRLAQEILDIYKKNRNAPE